MEDVSNTIDNTNISVKNADDRIINYIGIIRNKLMPFIPPNATPQTHNLQEFLDEHLERTVIETIKEDDSSQTHTNLDADTLQALAQAARLAFVRNDFLLYPTPTLLRVSSKNADLSVNTVRFSEASYPANSNTLNGRTRQLSAKETEEAQLIKTADQLEEMAKRGESIDASNCLSFDTRLKQKLDIKKIPDNSALLTCDSQSNSDTKPEYVDKPRLAKILSKKLDEVSLELETLPYMDVEKLAENFVTDIIKVAKKTVYEYQLKKEFGSETMLKKVPKLPSVVDFVEIFGSFEEWPTIGAFSIEIGADRIADYMATWHYEENWLYDMDMVLAQSDACSDFYVYEVKWSIPTQEYPVPQATASIFFTIEVCRVLPLDCTVNVTYKFEGCDYIHEPFKHSFQEEWLMNIVEDKLKFFKTIAF